MNKRLLIPVVVIFAIAALFVGCADDDNEDGTQPTAPATPAGITAQQTLRSQVSLTWSDVANEDSFIVQRSLDSSAWALLIRTASNQLTATDPGIHANVRHWYRVSALNSVGQSGFATSAAIWTWPAVYDFSEDQTEFFTPYSPEGEDWVEWTWNTPNQCGTFAVLVPAGSTNWASLQANDTMPNQGWFECKIKVTSWSNGIDTAGFFVSKDPAEARDAVGIKFAQDSTWLVYYTASGRNIAATNPVLPVMSDNAWHTIRLFHRGDRWTVYYDGAMSWDGAIPNVAVGTYGLIQEWQIDSGTGPQSQSISLDDLANPAQYPSFAHAADPRVGHRRTSDGPRPSAKK